MRIILGFLTVVLMTGCAGSNDSADTTLTNSTLYVSYKTKTLVFKGFSRGEESKINTTDNFVEDAAIIHTEEGEITLKCLANVQAQSINNDKDEYLLTFSYSIAQADGCSAFEKTYRIKMGTESRAELFDY